MIGKVSCREATKLLSDASERKLGLLESASLKIHLSICQMCRNFDSQLRFLRKASEKFRTGDD